MESVTHLVLGATGQIGSELTRLLPAVGKTLGVSRPDVDYERPHSVIQTVRRHSPRVIWNAAAHTGVESLETERSAAFRINAEAPELLAQEARRLGAALVHFSTDYVFDGRKTGPYGEDDPPAPLNVYGASKRAGEEAIGSSGCNHVIIRTSWVYAATGRNFLTAIFRKGGIEGRIPVVDDQAGAPTWSRDIATACVKLASALMSDQVPWGLYHLTASGRTTWYQFAVAIRDGLIHRGFRWRAELVPVSSRDYPSHAARPLSSVLDCTRAARVLGLVLPSWRMSLEAVLDEAVQRLQGGSV